MRHEADETPGAQQPEDRQPHTDQQDEQKQSAISLTHRMPSNDLPGRER